MSPTTTKPFRKSSPIRAGMLSSRPHGSYATPCQKMQVHVNFQHRLSLRKGAGPSLSGPKNKEIPKKMRVGPSKIKEEEEEDRLRVIWKYFTVLYRWTMISAASKASIDGQDVASIASNPCKYRNPPQSIWRSVCTRLREAVASNSPDLVEKIKSRIISPTTCYKSV
ncbi:hypothetical protein EJ05DRAFT_505532 [Pseudovirgaria hyperparasitica]|uniref:Uncharacterized protein n=1 Tax=Pseudovirgaria hyperparasitica TaxID=470096 RepID=A0A6A6VQP7_9PEZI|nr:uncharacterized protein EJ05DRAFT_505532 [Pseudovirgaria hyperparasitica]KAF2752978.1 hypothetical protein EJ05DRAFT_505532 [Pseudovirgaria hyperparasitica]